MVFDKNQADEIERQAASRGRKFVEYNQENTDQPGLPSIDPEEFMKNEDHPSHKLGQALQMDELKESFPDGIPDHEDSYLWPNGPLQSEVLAWKKMFGKVSLTEIDEDAFIWRKISRVEYKAITAIPNTTPLQREEMICEVCVLWPYGFNYEAQAESPAGIVGTMAKVIMQGSGFINNPHTTVL